MTSKIDRPKPIKTRLGNINQPPSSSRLWYPTIEQMQYIRNNYVKDIFWYSGPGANESGSYQGANWPNPRCDHTCSCYYYVILHGPPKADTSNPARQLGGVIVPWAYEGDNGPSANAHPASVHWHSPADRQTFTTWSTSTNRDVSTGRIWSSSNNYPQWVDPSSNNPSAKHLDMYCDMSKNIHLFEHRDPAMAAADYKTFQWTPESDGGFTYGILETRQIQVAALTIFECPDQSIYDTQEQDIVRNANMAPSSVVRGYESGSPGSYGDLVHDIGNGDTYGAGIQDSAVNGALHCLYQSGGPMAWYSDDAAYTNIRAGEASYFRVSYPNLTNTDGTVEAYPAVVVSGAGLTAGTKGYLKLTSKNTADTWVLEITQDNTKLYHTTDGSQESITIVLDSTPADNYDDIKVELYVDDDGASDFVIVQSISLWAKDPFTYTA